jgi:hypothetical protein
MNHLYSLVQTMLYCKLLIDSLVYCCIRIDVSCVKSKRVVSEKSNSSTIDERNSWTIGIFSTCVLFLRRMLRVANNSSKK